MRARASKEHTMTDFSLQADRLRDPEDLDALLELAAQTLGYKD